MPAVPVLESFFSPATFGSFATFYPEVVLSSKCEARWKQNATVSPVIDGWDVDSWIKDIANEDEEVQRLLWETIAAIFRPDHAFDKALLFVSESGSNGKVTFLELLRNLVGRHRVATVSLADFDRQFIPIQLATSFAVLSDENAVGSYLANSQNLKAWISHDWITLDRKNRDAIQIKGRGLSVFCLNELPQSQDKIESLYRRFVPVPFKRRYMDGEKNPSSKTTTSNVRRCSIMSRTKPCRCLCLRHSRCPQRVRSCSTRSVWTTTRCSSLSTSSEATIDTAETRDQLIIAAYYHDSAGPIEFEDLEEALTSGHRAGEVRTYARKREFDTSPSGYLAAEDDTKRQA